MQNKRKEIVCDALQQKRTCIVKKPNTNNITNDSDISCIFPKEIIVLLSEYYLDLEIKATSEEYLNKWLKVRDKTAWQENCKSKVTKEDINSLNHWCFGDDAVYVNKDNSKPNHVDRKVHLAFLLKARGNFAPVCKKFNDAIQMATNVSFGIQFSYHLHEKYLKVIGLLPFSGFYFRFDDKCDLSTVPYKKFYLKQFDVYPEEEKHVKLFPKPGLTKTHLGGVHPNMSELGWVDYENIKSITVRAGHNMMDVFQFMADNSQNNLKLKICDDGKLEIPRIVKGLEHVKIKSCSFWTRETGLLCYNNFRNLMASVSIDELIIFGNRENVYQGSELGDFIKRCSLQKLWLTQFFSVNFSRSELEHIIKTVIFNSSIKSFILNGVKDSKKKKYKLDYTMAEIHQSILQLDPVFLKDNLRLAFGVYLIFEREGIEDDDEMDNDKLEDDDSSSSKKEDNNDENNDGGYNTTDDDSEDDSDDYYEEDNDEENDDG
jgi:hypothetical protein